MTASQAVESSGVRGRTVVSWSCESSGAETVAPGFGADGSRS